MESILTSLVIGILMPALKEVGKGAAKTIGQKVVEKTIQLSTWEKIKRLFIIEEEEEDIKNIEKKEVATDEDISKIQDKLEKALATNASFAKEIKDLLKLSSTDAFYVDQIINSMEQDFKKLGQLMDDSRLAGVGVDDQYELEIRRVRRRLENNENKLKELLSL